jgi:uncharacterized cupredoxin-like copper-binding protein
VKKTILSAFMTANILCPIYAFSDGIHDHKSHNSETSGQMGDPKNVTKEIIVEANDNMRFTPSSINVKKGETIKITLLNKGKVNHELVLGSKKELKIHAEMMLKNPTMKHQEGESSITAEPGQSKSLIWKFTKSGTVDFGCLLPGHYPAGMVGEFKVK